MSVWRASGWPYAIRCSWAPGPFGVIRRHSRNEDFAQIAALVREQGVQAVICGLPLNMDGTEGDQARTTRKWAMRLAQALRTLSGKPVPIIFWDERLSTFAAQEILAATRQKTAEDAVAAAVLLQGYLDAQRLGERHRVWADRSAGEDTNDHSQSAPVAAGPAHPS